MNSAQILNSGRDKAIRNNGNRILVFVVGGILALVTILGWLSNYLESADCEKDVANYVTNDFQAATNVYCFHWDASVSPNDFFRSGTIITVEHFPPEHTEDYDFLMSLRAAKRHVPFITTVDWAWATSAMRGYSGQCTYLTAFCWHFRIGCDNEGEY